MLADAADILGAEREACLCRELTKRFEEIKRAPLGELTASLKGVALKGEVVLLIGEGAEEAPSAGDLEERLRGLLGEMSLRDAADILAAETGVKRRAIYQMGLKIED